MIIKRMYATFGKLDEACLDLSGGMNVLYGANESGKSTWSAFLRVMLYGISTKERTKIGVMADKEKYAPWSGKPMYGKIEFSWQGKDYILERTSGRGAVLQAAKITEVESGKILDIPEPVGETLLGIRREVYERTAFIGQAQLALSGDKTGELEKKICALATTGEEDVSHKIIIERLEKGKRALKYNKKGDIPRLEEELYQIDRTIAVAYDEEKQEKVLREEIERLKNEENIATANIETAKILSARENLSIILSAEEEAIKGEALQAEAEAKKLLTSNQKAEISQKLKQFEEINKKYTECNERYQQAKENYVENVPEGIGAKHIVYALVGAGFAALSAIVIPWYIGLALSFAVFFALFFLLRSAAYKKLGVRNKEEIGEKYAASVKSAQIIAILEEDCHRYAREASQAEENLKSLLNMIPEDGSAESAAQLLKRAEEQEEELNNLAQRAKMLRARADALKTGRDIEKLKVLAEKEITGEVTTFTESELSARIADCRAQREINGRRLAAIEERVKARGEIADLEAKRSALEAELLQKNKEYTALDVASNLICEIQTEMARKFAPTVEKRAGEIFEDLTGARFSIVRIEDAELNLSVAENDATQSRSILQLSGGTLDELYLSVRLALCEALLEKEVPILLDDALVNFDDTRMTKTMNFLKKLSEDRQILVFTCHCREKEFAKSNNAAVVSL